MKIAIKNLIATTLTAFVLTGTAVAADGIKNVNEVTVLNEVKNINKINVAGNVELILVQSMNESVRVYDDYYAKNALVQEKNGELFVSSFASEKLTVVAYVNHLTNVTATDNATISTFGKLSLLSLNIKLQSNASAELNLNTVVLTTNLSDDSNLKLTGSTTDFKANVNNLAKLNMDGFTADSSKVNSKSATIVNVPKDSLHSIVLEKIG